MPIDPQTAHALEAALAGVPGVLGAVVLDEGEDLPLEVQAFVASDADLEELGPLLVRVASEVSGRAVEVVPLQLAGGPSAGTDRPGTQTGSEDARPRRPRLVSVVLDSSVVAARHEALVSLQDTGLAAGRATVGRDPGLALVAAACDALSADGDDAPVPRAVERISIDGVDVVVVAVTVRGRPLIGTAVLDDEPEPAAVVRATLDAVNRWYGSG